jgi:GTPase
MAFIDELNIKIKAGTGGNGVVRFAHTKETELGGPSGGDGGRGGDVYARAVRDVHLLSRYKFKKELVAEAGGHGGKKTLHGAAGEDLVIDLPIGSVITNKQTKEKYFLNTEDEKLLLLKGGRGGRGNESFKSSTNQTPTEYTVGEKGESADFYIEVELIADIGLIGEPNAGKTSFLNEISNAKGAVGAYPFTTLEPNLGEAFGYIVADIPGLIEGASEGKGLGHKFLRHIRRVKLLAHLVSLENTDPIATYQTIRAELEKFDPEMIEKPEIVILTKTDVINNPEKIAEVVSKISKLNPKVLTMTAFDDAEVKKVFDALIKEVKAGE